MTHLPRLCVLTVLLASQANAAPIVIPYAPGFNPETGQFEPIEAPAASPTSLSDLEEIPPPPCLQVDLDLPSSPARSWIESNISPHFSWVLSAKYKDFPKGFPEGEFKYRRVCQVLKATEGYLALVSFSDKIGGLCRPTAADSYFAQLFQFDPETKDARAVWVTPVNGSGRLWNAQFSVKSGCDGSTPSAPPIVEFSPCVDCEDSTVYSARLKFELKERIIKKKDGTEEKVIEKRWGMLGPLRKSSAFTPSKK